MFLSSLTKARAFSYFGKLLMPLMNNRVLNLRLLVSSITRISEYCTVQERHLFAIRSSFISYRNLLRSLAQESSIKLIGDQTLPLVVGSILN
jgi:hypothetical protein